LYLPWAQLNPAAPELAARACSTLSEHGVGHVDTATSVELPSAGLDAYDGLFVGGGNTYLLLDRLRSTGLAKVLIASVRAGMPCYGGSAGAIVLGAHIGTCAHMDRDEVGTVDARGLGVLGGFAVWCHYSSFDAENIRSLSRETRLSVLALEANAGAVFDGVNVTPIGPGSARVWTAEGSQRGIL
jgi:dipeptidase E